MEDKKVFVPVKYNNDQKIIFKDVSDETLSFLDSISHVTHYSYLNRTYIPVIMFDQDDVNINILTSDSQLEERSLSELTLNVLVEFAKWIDDSNLHSWSKQVREAMIIYKVDTIEELVLYFMDNVYKSK